MNDKLPIELQNIEKQSIIRFVMSGAAKDSKWRKISAVKLESGIFQVEKFTGKQSFHEKITDIENIFQHEIFSFFGTFFMQMEIFTEEFSYSFRAAKKRILFKKSKLKKPIQNTAKTHDRTKNHLLREGMQIPALVDLGVFHSDFTPVKKSIRQIQTDKPLP